MTYYTKRKVDKSLKSKCSTQTYYMSNNDILLGFLCLKFMKYFDLRYFFTSFDIEGKKLLFSCKKSKI